MRRLLIYLMLLILPFTTSFAQDPATTEEVPPDEGEEVIDEEPTPPPAAPVAAEMPLLVDARADLELLALTVLGPSRPEGWNGSLDINNPQLALLIRLDLELLAGTLLGPDQRPGGWFGAVQSTPYNIARDIRHDLEALADRAIGPGQRPEGWVGADPLMRCSRSTQALVNILQRGGVFTLNVDPNSPTYCRDAELVASQFVEVNLLSQSGSGPLISAEYLPKPQGAEQITTDFAVAFLDVNASLRVGVVPNGTPVNPVGRSTSQFSKMVLVTGDGFAVFIEYTNTTITQDRFNSLPDATTSGVEPFCGAQWCGAG